MNPTDEPNIFASLSQLDYTFPLTVGGLIFVRLMVAISLTPYLGSKPIPGNIRVGFCFALTLFVYFLASPQMDKSLFPTSYTLILILVLKEAFFGMFMGMINSMVFYGIQTAGSMIDNQRSLANARIFNPAMASQTSLFGSYFYQLSIAVFIVTGGHRMFLKALLESFQKVPLYAMPTMRLFKPESSELSGLPALIVNLSAESLLICLQLAAPIIVAIFIADVILGITNRIAPMINVSEMGFNLKGFIGSVLIYFAIPVVIYQNQVIFKKMFSLFYQVSDLFLR